MSGAGVSRRWHSASSSARRACTWLLCALCLLLSPVTVTAQSNKPQSIEQQVIDLLAELATFRQALAVSRFYRQDLEKAYDAIKQTSTDTEQRLLNRIAELQSESESWKRKSEQAETDYQNSSTDSQKHLADLQVEIRRLTSLSDALKQDSDQSSKAFEDFKRDTERDILRLTIQRNLWALGFFAAMAAAAGITVWAVVK